MFHVTRKLIGCFSWLWHVNQFISVVDILCDKKLFGLVWQVSQHVSQALQAVAGVGLSQV